MLPIGLNLLNQTGPTKELLKRLFNDEKERTTETEELKNIPKGKLPTARVADFPRAINIVENIKELRDGDRNLLRKRLVDIENVVHALTVSPSWEKIATILNPNKQYPTFSVPSQRTPKAMFSGVNAISKAAESFFGTLRKKADAEIVAKKELSEINENAAQFVLAINETINTILNARGNLKLSELKFDMGSHLGTILLSFSISLEAEEGEDAALATIRKTVDSIHAATNWTAVSKAIEGKTVKNIKSKIIPKKTLDKIVENWNTFCAVLSIGVRLKQLADNIEKTFDAFGKSRKMAVFVTELGNLKFEAKKLYEQLKVSQLNDIENKLTHLISSDIGNVKGILGGIEKDPIKQDMRIFSLMTPEAAKFAAINSVVDTFNESVKKLLKKMESWK